MSYELELYDLQADFLDDPARYTGFIGGVGSGKTYAGAAKALLWMLEHPSHERGLITAPTYGMLADATIPTCREVWGDLVRSYIKTPHPQITLVTGQEAWFRSTENPDSLRGPNMWWDWSDEGAYSSRAAWRQIIARLRAGGLAGPAWITSTPNQQNWLYEDLVQTGILSLHVADTRANPYVSEAWVADLEAQYPEQYAAQELRGKFIRFGAGMVQSAWFRHIDYRHVPLGLKWYRYWDLALTIKKQSDYTASVRCCHLPNGKHLYSRPLMFKATWPDVKAKILETMRQEQGRTIAHGIESNGFQLAGAQELALTDEAKRSGIFPVHQDTDKLSRALPWIGQTKMGNVYLVNDPVHSWDHWKEVITAFPTGDYDDAVDAMSGAFDMEDQIAMPVVSVASSTQRRAA